MNIDAFKTEKNSVNNLIVTLSHGLNVCTTQVPMSFDDVNILRHLRIVIRHVITGGYLVDHICLMCFIYGVIYFVLV